MVSDLSQQVKFKAPGSYVLFYSYKPAVYFAGAFVYHFVSRRVRAI